MRAIVFTAAALLIPASAGVALYGYDVVSLGKTAGAVVSGPTDPSPTARPQSALLQFAEQPRPLPDFRFADEDGAEVTLADFRGKVVLLNVWATWCVPCRKEMPTLDALQAQLGGAEFEVVTLSIDRGSMSRVRDFYEETGLEHLKVYIEESAGAVSTQLNVIGLPTTLLIDRQGREIGRVIGPAEWDSPEIVAMVEGVLKASRTAQAEPADNRGGPQAAAVNQISHEPTTDEEAA